MSAIVKPGNEAALSKLVREHAKHRKGLHIQGGGTRPVGYVPQDLQPLSTSMLAGVELYEPGALTLVAKVGTPLDSIEKMLAAEGQHLPFEPADYRPLLGTKGLSTIGGVVASAVAGPRRIQAGGARDSLIGVRFVSGEGEIIKNGGRVMKNVTGYDLVKLMCGSRGTLGILTEVSFKLLPKAEASGTVVITGLDDEAAIGCLAKAMGSPFDVSGAAHVQKTSKTDAQTLMRVEGLSDSVDYRLSRLKEALAPHTAKAADVFIISDKTKSESLWKAIRDVKHFVGREGQVWRLSVKPGDGPKVVEKIAGQMACEAIYDWGGGLVWLLTNAPTREAAQHIRNSVNSLTGHATLFRRNGLGDSNVPVFHPEPDAIRRLASRLRKQFDPSGIFNPGLMEAKEMSNGNGI